MPGPITWRNVGQGTGLGVASRILDRAGDQFQGSLNTLGGMLNATETNREDNRIQGVTNNTNAFMDQLAAYENPEDLQAAEAQLRQQLASYGPVGIDRSRTDGAIDSRISGLQNEVTTQRAYDRGNLEAEFNPIAEQIRALTEAGNFKQASELQATHSAGLDQLGLSAGLTSGIRDTQRRFADDGRADQALAFDNELLPAFMAENNRYWDDRSAATGGDLDTSATEEWRYAVNNLDAVANEQNWTQDQRVTARAQLESAFGDRFNINAQDVAAFDSSMATLNSQYSNNLLVNRQDETAEDRLEASSGLVQEYQDEGAEWSADSDDAKVIMRLGTEGVDLLGDGTKVPVPAEMIRAFVDDYGILDGDVRDWAGIEASAREWAATQKGEYREYLDYTKAKRGLEAGLQQLGGEGSLRASMRGALTSQPAGASVNDNLAYMDSPVSTAALDQAATTETGAPPLVSWDQFNQQRDQLKADAVQQSVKDARRTLAQVGRNIKQASEADLENLLERLNNVGAPRGTRFEIKKELRRRNGQ